jgi:hypothetical protein
MYTKEKNAPEMKERGIDKADRGGAATHYPLWNLVCLVDAMSQSDNIEMLTEVRFR